MGAAARRLAALARQLPAPAARPAPVSDEETDLDTIVVTDHEAPLTQEQIDYFMTEGYVALPGMIPDEFNAELIAGVDALMESRAEHGGSTSGNWDHGLIPSFGALGDLCSWPPIVEKVKQLCAQYGNGATEVGMHHIHARWQVAGERSSPWHQARPLPQAGRQGHPPHPPQPPWPPRAWPRGFAGRTI